jgi:hypothetical protein
MTKLLEISFTEIPSDIIIFMMRKIARKLELLDLSHSKIQNRISEELHQNSKKKIVEIIIISNAYLEFKWNIICDENRNNLFYELVIEDKDIRNDLILDLKSPFLEKITNYFDDSKKIPKDIAFLPPTDSMMILCFYNNHFDFLSLSYHSLALLSFSRSLII